MSPLSLPRLEAPGIRHFSDPKATSVYLRLCNFSINDKGVFGHSCIGSVSRSLSLSLGFCRYGKNLLHVITSVLDSHTADIHQGFNWRH